MSQIYKITNNINGHSYIGKTDYTFEQRWKEHLKDRKRVPNKSLYRAFNKYGIENFSIELIEDGLSKEEALIREQYWISYFDTYNNGYNQTLGGDGSTISFSTKEEVEYLIQLYNEKKTLKEIGDILGYHSDTISKKLHELGFKVFPSRQKTRTIYQLDKNTEEVIAEFQSTMDAARALGNSDYNKHISAAARGERKSAYGFKWRYK